MALLSFDDSPHGGRQRLLPEWDKQPKIIPTTIIDHSVVGSAEGAFQHFLRNTGIESHFIVDLDGAIWQLMDTSRQADANLDANRFAVSIETADNGDPDNFPWTSQQLNSLIWLHEELVLIHPLIPRQRCPTWDGGGLGYHTLFGAPSHWTPVSKTCPGRVRKIQWAEVLLPAFLTPEENDDMTADELIAAFTSGGSPIRAAIRDLNIRAVNSALGHQGLGPIDTTAVGAGSPARKGVDNLIRSADDESTILTKLDQLAAQLTAVAARVAAIESDVDELIERTQPEEPPA